VYLVHLSPEKDHEAHGVLVVLFAAHSAQHSSAVALTIFTLTEETWTSVAILVGCSEHVSKSISEARASIGNSNSILLELWITRGKVYP
jgi:hypothetical protein